MKKEKLRLDQVGQKMQALDTAAQGKIKGGTLILDILVESKPPTP